MRSLLDREGAGRGGADAVAVWTASGVTSGEDSDEQHGLTTDKPDAAVAVWAARGGRFDAGALRLGVGGGIDSSVVAVDCGILGCGWRSRRR